MSYYLTPNTPFDPNVVPLPGQFGSLGAIHPTTGGAPPMLSNGPAPAAPPTGGYAGILGKS